MDRTGVPIVDTMMEESADFFEEIGKSTVSGFFGSDLVSISKEVSVLPISLRRLIFLSLSPVKKGSKQEEETKQKIVAFVEDAFPNTKNQDKKNLLRLVLSQDTDVANVREKIDSAQPRIKELTISEAWTLLNGKIKPQVRVLANNFSDDRAFDLLFTWNDLAFCVKSFAAVLLKDLTQAKDILAMSVAYNSDELEQLKISLQNSQNMMESILKLVAEFSTATSSEM